MRFSVLIEIYCGFAVLGIFFLCGISVSNRPQCPLLAAGIIAKSGVMNSTTYI